VRLWLGPERSTHSEAIGPIASRNAEMLTAARAQCGHHHQRVFGEWRFDRKLPLGKGVNALFAWSVRVWQA